MQGIYTYIPETNYVPKEYIVAAILFLLYMVLISLVPMLTLLYFSISTFRSMCEVTNVAVFCSSLTSWFPGMLLTYFLNDFIIIIIIIITFTHLYLAHDHVCYHPSYFTGRLKCVTTAVFFFFILISSSHWLCLTCSVENCL